MVTTNPRFTVEILKCIPVGKITHAVKVCPRCECNIGITAAMRAGMDSIICKGRDGHCNGHYYLRGNHLEFMGTV